MKKDKITQGLQALIRDLEKEIRKKSFHSFEINYTPRTWGPYLPNHELLELNVLHKVDDVTKEEVYQYLKSQRGRKWYRCQNYRKASRPIKIK